MIKTIKGLSAAKQAIKSGPKVVIKFFAPWCGSCQKVEAMYKKLPKQHPNVKFYKVNIDDNKDLSKQYNVEYVPTFLYYRNMSLKARVVGSDQDDITDKVKNL